ncbi:MAG: glycosyltransferase [bacterium]
MPRALTTLPAMRIVMVNSTSPDTFGGVERWMVRASRGLVRRGHTVHLAARRGGRLLEEARGAELPAHGHRFGPDWNPLSALRLARLARRHGLEAAVVNHNKELTHAALARRLSPLRRVVGRSVLPMMDTGGRHRRLYEKHLDGMITPSREVRRVVEGYAWMRDVRVQNIPNGLDLEALDAERDRLGGRDVVRSELSLTPDAFVVCGVGRLEPHKGYDVLLDAFEEVARERDEAHLVLVGDGSRADELRDRAGGLEEGASRVLFTGFRPDPYRFMMASDVLVLPSTTEYETFGQVLIEAMALYVPVVGSRIGGIPEVIRDGENGLLVEPGDARDLGRALLRLALDREERRRFAREGRCTVEEHYREETMLDRLETYLEDLLT